MSTVINGNFWAIIQKINELLIVIVHNRGILTEIDPKNRRINRRKLLRIFLNNRDLVNFPCILESKAIDYTSKIWAKNIL